MLEFMFFTGKGTAPTSKKGSPRVLNRPQRTRNLLRDFEALPLEQKEVIYSVVLGDIIAVLRAAILVCEAKELGQGCASQDGFNRC